MTAYYNEFDPYAAQWLRNLISADLIAPGEVDERSITDVRPSELAVFTQCHFFAGIGGWSRALRLAGWGDDRPVWTGSCPCQPFSAAGKQQGVDDARHLWPVWFDLIRECRPSTVFGEQVAAAVGHHWLDAVQGDMEGEGYAVGAAVFGAHSVGSPHIRQRLWFGAQRVADAGSERRDGEPVRLQSGRQDEARVEAAGGCEAGLMADTGRQHGERRSHTERPLGENQTKWSQSGSDYQCRGEYGGSGPLHGFWRDADWLFCRDGKWRPVEPGSFPLAHGVSNRVGRLRAYGNAIVPQVAAKFIAAFEECRP